jgi:hypothetical protein
MHRLAAETEAALSKVALRGRQIRSKPAKLPPLSEDTLANEIPEPDSLGG